MRRFQIVVVALLAFSAFMLASFNNADAANQYLRKYNRAAQSNIGGINYGAQQWYRRHQNLSNASPSQIKAYFRTHSRR